MKLPTVVLFALVLAGSGCGDAVGPGGEPGRVSVRTDRTAYRPGDLVVTTSINRTGRTVYEDHCGGEVQGFEFRDRWDVSYGVARGCRDYDPQDWRSYAVAIPDGTTHVDTLFVNARAYNGTWRVLLQLLDEEGTPLPEDQGISNTFRVDGGWNP